MKLKLQAMKRKIHYKKDERPTPSPTTTGLASSHCHTAAERFAWAFAALQTIKISSSMKTIACAGLVLILAGCSKHKDTPTLKSILLEQLRYTHTKKDWYVPLNAAVEGLTVEQANWSDSTDNHSIGQIVSHLAFWNERVLIAFQGHKPPAFNENNQETFTRFDKNQWQQTVHRLDSIQTLWERSVEGATEAQLHEWSSSIANICTHNAYHTGQIVYIRKKNGWWQAAKGVK